MKKIVFIDIDGTLYDHDNRCIPESALKALQLAKNNGHELFICTGRPKSKVEDFYSTDLPISGIVYAGGAHIEINNKVVYQASFPIEYFDSLIEKFKEYEIEYVIEGKDYIHYTKRAFELVKNVYISDGEDISFIFDESKGAKFIEDFKEEDKEQVLKFDLYAKEDERVYQLMNDLPEELDGFVYKELFCDGILEAEIIIKGADKSNGINKIIELFDCGLENTVAMGDSANDITMIKHANVGIAMGNAGVQLKEHADYITKNIDEDGLYHAFVYAGLISE